MVQFCLYLWTFLYSGFSADLHLLWYDSCNITVSLYHDGWWWYLQFDKLLFRTQLNSSFCFLRKAFQGSASVTVKSYLFSPGKIKLLCSAENGICALSTSGSDCGLERYPVAAGQLRYPAVMTPVLYRGNPLKCVAWKYVLAPTSPHPGGTVPAQQHHPAPLPLWSCILPAGACWAHTCAVINQQYCPSSSKGCSDFMWQRGKRKACCQL